MLIGTTSIGIGKATCAELAKRGATVVMGCRNLELAKEAILDIRKVTDKGNLVNISIGILSGKFNKS